MRGGLLRLAALIATIAGLVGLMPAPASPAPAVAHPVSGTVAGSLSLALYTDPDCFHGIVFDLDVEGEVAPFGGSTVDVDTCDLAPAGGGGGFQGAFTLTADDGTLSGAVAYSIVGTPPTGSVLVDLMVTGGTGRYAGATGSIRLDIPLDQNASAIVGTVSGSVTFGLPTPSSKGDCMHGGFRAHADANGEAFKNQGRCIAYVQRHT